MDLKLVLLVIFCFQQSVEGETYYMLINGSWESLITAASLMNMKKRLRMPKVNQQTPDIQTMRVLCRASVADVGPTQNQHV